MKKRITALLLCAGLLIPSDTFSKPELKAHSAGTRQLNIITVFGSSEAAIYGVPNAFNERFERIAAKVSGYYNAAFSINLKFSKPTTNFIVYSPADTCRGNNSTNIIQLCTHTTDANCNNNGPYHCSNCKVIKNSIFPLPRPNLNGVEMYITATKLCSKDGTTHHGNIMGMHYSSNHTMIVRDTDYTYQSVISLYDYYIKRVCKTVAHEIGHAYGVADHYNTVYGDDRDNCIWGSNKDDKDICENLTICSTCRQTILDNGNKFNYT